MRLHVQLILWNNQQQTLKPKLSIRQTSLITPHYIDRGFLSILKFKSFRYCGSIKYFRTPVHRLVDENIA